MQPQHQTSPVQYHKGPLIPDRPYPRALAAQLMGRLSPGCGDWPHTHSGQVDWPVTGCLQKVLKHDSLNHRRILSSLFIQIHFFPPCARSVHSCLIHTQTQLFVYVEIFSNRASEGYTAGGKHWDLRWRVSVLSLLFVYISLLLPGDIWLMEEIWEHFPLIAVTPKVPVLDLC